MSINGGSIQRYISKPPLAQFGYNVEYELEQARKHAQIDPETWHNIPASYIWIVDENYCKADYIVLYRLSQKVESVASDVQVREIEKQRRQSKFNRGK